MFKYHHFTENKNQEENLCKKKKKAFACDMGSLNTGEKTVVSFIIWISFLSCFTSTLTYVNSKSISKANLELLPHIVTQGDCHLLD